MMENSFYLWRDAVDPQSFMIGVKRTDADKYMAWTTVFIDGIEDMFGKSFAEFCKGLDPIRPVLVSVVFTVSNLEPIP